jgi:hypothetical protein
MKKEVLLSYVDEVEMIECNGKKSKGHRLFPEAVKVEYKVSGCANRSFQSPIGMDAALVLHREYLEG